MADVKFYAGETPKVGEYILAQGTAGVQVGTESYKVSGGREDIFLQSDNWGDHNFGAQRQIPGSFNLTLGGKVPLYFTGKEDGLFNGRNGVLFSGGLSISKTSPYSLYSTAYDNAVGEQQDQPSASEIETFQLTAHGLYFGPAVGFNYIHVANSDQLFFPERVGIRVAREYGLTSFELASSDGLNVARGEYASEIDDVTSRRTTLDLEAAFNLPTTTLNLLLQAGLSIYDATSGDVVRFDGTDTAYGLSASKKTTAHFAAGIEF